MKVILSFLFVCISIATIAQEPFEKDKKWGLSKFGEGPDSEGDSVIFRAEYDEILSIPFSDGNAYAGLKGEEWVLLTTNRLVHQQRYQRFVPYERNNNFCYAVRDGYIDIIDLVANDYLIRNVQADGLVESHSLDVGEVLITYKGKEEFFGLINIKNKKEILKPEYSIINGNYENIENAGTVIAYKGGENYVYDYEGKLVFKFSTENVITKVQNYPEIDNSYKVYCEGKKGETVGFYESQNKWFVPPIYNEVMFIENLPEIVIVKAAKGLGLYFQGKMILPCEYLSITKSDKRGYIAIVTTKKGDFYVADDGKLTPYTKD